MSFEQEQPLKDPTSLPPTADEDDEDFLSAPGLPDSGEIFNKTGVRISPVVPSMFPDKRWWLIDGWIHDESVSFLVAQPKLGKTWLALEMALAVCLRRPFLGKSTGYRGRVLYFAGEDAPADILTRIDRLLKGCGLDRNALGKRLAIVRRPVQLDDPDDRDLLKDLFRSLEPTLVVFDPLARFLGSADEDSATKLRPIINWLRHTVTRTNSGTSVLIVHHTDKKSRGMRGSGDLRAVGETIMTLGEGKTSGSIRLSFETRDVRPDSFDARLVDLPDGGIRWVTKDAGAADDHAGLARRLLAEAGCEGLGVTSARQRLGVKAATVPKILGAAGGVQRGNRGRWYLPQFLSSSEPSPLPKAGNFPEREIPSVGTDRGPQVRQEVIRDNVQSGMQLGSIVDPQQAPFLPVSTFPSAPTPQEGAGGEGGKNGENGNSSEGGAL